MRDLVVVGLSHHTAPVEVRERLAVAPDDLAQELQRFKTSGAFAEAILVSTCNRVELYASSVDPLEATQAASHLFAQRLAPVAAEDILYHHIGKDAVRHSFRVASSLDSLVVGEPQILGQVKEAFDAARTAGTVGTLLGRCFTHAFSVAKRVRTETKLAQGTVSVSSIACELAKKIFGDLRGRKVLLIGAGEMAESAARTLRQLGARLHVANRNQERAEKLASSFGGRAADYEQLSTELADADVVITSTASARFILTPELMQGIVHARRHRPLFIVDIAVPRDVDPRVGNLDNVFVYDVDDLQKVAEDNLAVREREAAHAERIVVEELQAFEVWQRSLMLTPTIVALRNRFARIIESELEGTLRKLDNLGPEERRALEQMSKATVNKLLHTPLTELRQSAVGPEGALLIAAAQRLFDLPEEPDDEDEVPAVAVLTPAEASGSQGDGK